MTALRLDPAAAPSRSTEAHFALYIYAAFIRLMQEAARHCEGVERALQRWPFLEPYVSELAAHGLEGVPLTEAGVRWSGRIAAFEADAQARLPLRALADVYALEHDDLLAIAACLWPETEARFAPLFEALHGVAGEARPTGSLLARWVQGGEARIRDLIALGLLEYLHGEAPFPLRPVAVAPLLADALRGRPPPSDAMPLSYRPAASLPELDALVLPEALRSSLVGAADLLGRGALDVLVIRGPRRNGRRTMARAVARRLGRGTVECGLVGAAGAESLPRWAPLAAALGGLTVLRAEPGPGETVVLPSSSWRHGPFAVTLPPQGGLELQGDARVLDFERPLPDRAEREAMWRDAVEGDGELEPAVLARCWRMSGGAIARATRGARVRAAAAGRRTIAMDDLRVARRLLGREALDTLATLVPAESGWSTMVAAADTRSELALLEVRCRHREALGERLFDGGSTTGVRALFKGSSGTGKTLAARALAGALGMDLYRVDLAAVTSKYVGETEKNLDRVLAAAEALDIVLLLDEGDSLLGARTSTQSANDRFANLETNFLLQRLEAFQAILVVTTNAPENIDSAFQRRMDVTIEFPAPGREERAAIWRLHLPRGHAVPESWVDEVAWRCVLTGGQIRNATLHAALLALDAGRPLAVDHLSESVEREYRKAGTVCPLRRMSIVQAR